MNTLAHCTLIPVILSARSYTICLSVHALTFSIYRRFYKRQDMLGPSHNARRNVFVGIIIFFLMKHLGGVLS